MVAPLIGITTSVTIDKIPERAYVNGTYIRAVQAAGGIPVLLTPALHARGPGGPLAAAGRPRAHRRR